MPHPLLRDLDGFVHTPRGYIAPARYDQLCAENPEHPFPLRSDIPLMTELSDAELAAWYRGNE